MRLMFKPLSSTSASSFYQLKIVPLFLLHSENHSHTQCIKKNPKLPVISVTQNILFMQKKAEKVFLQNKRLLQKES